MDTLKLTHAAIDVVALAGLTYYMVNQNKALQVQIDELKKQLSHVATHVNNSYNDNLNQVKVLSSEVDKLKRTSERTSSRAVLRSAAIEDEEPPRTVKPRIRSRPLSPEEPPRRTDRNSPPREAAREAAREALKAPVDDEPEEVYESDREAEDEDDVTSVLRTRSSDNK